MNMKTKTLVRVILPLVIALLSFFILSGIASSPTTYRKTIESLDEKKTAVTGVAAAITATSSLITLIPGETATSIANEIADLSSWLIVVLGAIYLEKYLLTIIGIITFKLLIPVACLIAAVNVFYKSDVCRRIIKKLVITGIVIICIIPASEKVSKLIQDTYDESIQMTMELVTQEIKVEENEEGWFSSVISELKEGVTETATQVENILTNFIDAIAVMIVTSCLIPIVVLMFFVWFIKVILGMNISFSSMEKLVSSKEKVHELMEKKLIRRQ